MEKLKGIIQKWNSISLVKRIICGLIIGIILGLVVPQASAISILGDLFGGQCGGCSLCRGGKPAVSDRSYLF